MIEGRTVLGIIPARGGSKGIPHKNIVDLGGRPLLAWTIEAARASRHIDRLILSSDDPAIMAVAESLGCEVPFVRPAELATDTADGLAPVFHALEALPERWDYVVLLQPTSPLRLGEDIDACLRACAPGKAPSCVSVCEAAKSPYWMFFREADGRLTPALPGTNYTARRQDLPTAYVLNGAVYAASADWFQATRGFITPETVCHVMPAERSLDIDTPLDLALCAEMVRRRNVAKESFPWL